MAAISNQVSERVAAPAAADPPQSAAFDWAAALLAFWVVAGGYTDAWAHNHVPNLEAFFTPWHAILYSGFLVLMTFYVVNVLRNHRSGYSWRHSVPAGYGPSALGVALFFVSGIGDGIWHTLFGIERDIEAVFSPTHLGLIVGMFLMAGGPRRAAMRRPGPLPRDWRAWLPTILSLTTTLALLTLFTQFAHPYVNNLAALTPNDPSETPVDPYFTEGMGLLGILLEMGLLMGLVLQAVRRWTLPIGALTIALTVDALLLSFMSDLYWVIPAGLAAGLLGDLLLWWLRPSVAQPLKLRLFAFLLPAGYYACYFLALAMTQGIAWRIHLWLGAIFSAGAVGLALTYLIKPANVPEASVAGD